MVRRAAATCVEHGGKFVGSRHAAQTGGRRDIAWRPSTIAFADEIPVQAVAAELGWIRRSI